MKTPLSRHLAPFNKPIDTLEKTSGVSTPPGYGSENPSQTGSETGNPAKKIKHDPEQHIPDEILNDLYGVSYSSGFGIGGGAREDDQDNQEVPELDTKDSKYLIYSSGSNSSPPILINKVS